MTLGCGDGTTCSYGDTGYVTFGLPSDVSFTSDSGVFYRQPIGTPEPGTLSILAIGLGMLGFLRRAGLRWSRAAGKVV